MLCQHIKFATIFFLILECTNLSFCISGFLLDQFNFLTSFIFQIIVNYVFSCFCFVNFFYLHLLIKRNVNFYLHYLVLSQKNMLAICCHYEIVLSNQLFLANKLNFLTTSYHLYYLLVQVRYLQYQNKLRLVCLKYRYGFTYLASLSCQQMIILI